MRVYQTKVRFTMRGPWQTSRQSYSIWKDTVEDSGNRKQIEINDDRIEALTREYRDARKAEMSKRELDELVLIGRQALQEIKKDLEKSLGKQLKHIPLSSYNHQILEQYILKKVNVKAASRVGSLRSDRDHAKKCIRLLGINSIKTVEVDIIQNIINSSKSEGECKHLIMNFRRLLKFVGRYPDADRLRTKRFQPTKPPYLTEEQVEILASTVPEKTLKKHPLLADLIWITFDLGTRISESLAIEKKDVKKSDGNVVIRIERQLARQKDSKPDGSDRIRPTKNGSIRPVIPIKEERVLKSLERWLRAGLSMEEKESYRRSIDWYIRHSCKKRFGMDVEDVASDSFFDLNNLADIDKDRKYKAVHMLRAGHAVAMLSMTKGNSEFVAKQLGDTEDVVRKHYTGRTNRPASIAEVAKMIKQAQSAK